MKNKELWIIYSEGTPVVKQTFKEAMELFEGFNLPYKCKIEKFESAYNRVKEYIHGDHNKRTQ